MTDKGIILLTVLALVAASLTAEAQPAEPATDDWHHCARASPLVRGWPPRARLGRVSRHEGKNVRFERRLSTDNQKLSHFAAELIRIPVDVIFAGNAASTRVAMEATRVIPIITVSADTGEHWLRRLPRAAQGERHWVRDHAHRVEQQAARDFDRGPPDSATHRASRQSNEPIHACGAS